MTSLPLLYEWQGDGFKPVGRFAKEADAAFVIGERYLMAEVQDRSMKSHAHQFAEINEIWKSLPEDMAERWPTAEHLRKFALIRCGYADERSIVCASKAEARRVAAFIKPMDAYAIVTVSEAVVRVFTAQSQSRKAMGAKEFQESKTKILEFCAGLIGVAPGDVPKDEAA